MSNFIFSIMSKLPISVSRRFYNVLPFLKKNSLIVTNSPTGNWTDIVANENYVAACSCFKENDNKDNSMICLSSNGGSSWTTVDKKLFPEEMNWKAIDMSSDGKYITVISDADIVNFDSEIRTLAYRPNTNKKGSIYYSNDFGVSWNKASILDLGQNYSELSFKSICMSSDGKDQYIATNDGIFRSLDYGKNWECIYQFEQINGFIHKIVMSKVKINVVNNNYILGLIIKGTTTFKFYTSNNGGLSWNKTVSRIVQNKDWSSLSYTDSGKSILISSNNEIFKNDYYGLGIFSKISSSTPPPDKITDIQKRSDELSNFIISTNSAGVWLFNNSTFTQISNNNLLQNWTSVAMNSDHTNMFVTLLGGNIYTIM